LLSGELTITKNGVACQLERQLENASWKQVLRE
jgi:hypothetical protein